MTAPAHDHAARRQRLRATLADAGVDLLLVTAPANVRYLTGFTGSNGQVLIGPAAADDRLVTDARYTERAAVEAPDVEVVLGSDPGKVASEALTSGDGRRLGVEADHVSLATAGRWRKLAESSDAALVATVGLVETLREVKDDAEIAALAEACRLTVIAIEELFAERVAVGVSERELAVWLERRFVDLGAERVGFDSIVASGPNAAIPHHTPGERTLAAGDLLTVDCGAVVDGYHADYTRTVAVGHLADELAEVHALVVEAQAAGRAAAIAGARSGDVDRACRELITAAGYGERFVHGTGHGVGLAIHEAPAVAANGRATLQTATTLTVEPGVYLPGVGGVRIEDTIVVTADGAPPRVLTDTVHHLRVL